MPLNSSDQLLLSDIRSNTMDILRDVLGEESGEVILLDIPRHRNLGDSLIWKGELDYLRKLGCEVIHQSDLGRHRDADLLKLPRSATILLHGGGNFGDLYPENDNFRRHIVKSYSRRRIVMLPQTMHYKHSDEMLRAVSEYSCGENFTMLLRESRSMSLASQYFPSVDRQFCFDLALGAELPDRHAVRDRRVVTLARRDVEAVVVDGGRVPESEDWSMGKLNNFVWRACIGFGALYKRSGPRLQEALFSANQYINRNLLDLNIDAALRQFSVADVVATDRLHAHILSLLLGIPHVVTDNSYGKVSSIFSEYTGQFSTAQWAASIEEAVRTAQEMARPLGSLGH